MKLRPIAKACKAGGFFVSDETWDLDKSERRGYDLVMKSVYVFGPIHLFGKNYLPVYKSINKLCRNYFDRVIGTYPDFWDTKENPREFYSRTFRTIIKCDLFIGEVTSPSIGVGMEFQMAQEAKIPCIALCKKGVKPSKMLLGIPCVKKVLYYKNLTDLLSQLNNYLNRQKIKK